MNITVRVSDSLGPTLRFTPAITRGSTMKDLMREEWLRETKMFRRTTKLVLRYLLGSDRIPISEALFMEAYSDIQSCRP